MWNFLQARNYHKGRVGPPGCIVIVMHDMEAPEGNTTAEKVAAMWASPNSPMASAHFSCDRNSVIQSVKVGDTAFGAKGGNRVGVHIEQAGYARQSRAEWLRDEDMLNISSCVAAEVVVGLRIYPGITIQRRGLTDDEIRSEKVSGFCGHRDITRAKKIPGGHTDPGIEYPWDVFMAKVEWWIPHINTIDFH